MELSRLAGFTMLHNVTGNASGRTVCLDGPCLLVMLHLVTWLIIEYGGTIFHDV